MKHYRFKIYRTPAEVPDVEEELPEERVLETDEPDMLADLIGKGANVIKVVYVEEPDEVPEAPV